MNDELVSLLYLSILLQIAWPWSLNQLPQEVNSESWSFMKPIYACFLVHSKKFSLLSQLKDLSPYFHLPDFILVVLLLIEDLVSSVIHIIHLEIFQIKERQSCKLLQDVHSKIRKRDVSLNPCIIIFWKNPQVLFCRYFEEPFEKIAFMLEHYLILLANKLFPNNNQFASLNYFYWWKQNKHYHNFS